MSASKAKIHCPSPYFERQIKPTIKNDNLSEEIVWTYLVAKKYEDDPTLLAGKLCGRPEKLPDNPAIWLEAYLYPTRERSFEQSSWKIRADLAIGHLVSVKNRTRQITADGDWVCVAESKWFDDIHVNEKIPGVNQFCQLIEHALLLHDQDGEFPKRVYVTLITPAYFMNPHEHFSNMDYYSKYHEYQKNKEALVKDLEICTLPYLKHSYDSVVRRIDSLILNWVSFDDLLGLPNLVETQIPGKHKTNRKSWVQVLTELNRRDILELI